MNLAQANCMALEELNLMPLSERPLKQARRENIPGLGRREKDFYPIF